MTLDLIDRAKKTLLQEQQPDIFQLFSYTWRVIRKVHGLQLTNISYSL